ncbi:MAG: ATP-binding protein [Ilumatobacteraceae bacterium]
MGNGSDASGSGADSNAIVGALAARHLPSAVLVVGADRVVRWANEHAVRLLGDTLIDETLDVALVDDDDAIQLHDVLRRLRRGGDHGELPLVRFRDVEGRQLPAVVSATPLAHETADDFLVTIRPRPEGLEATTRAQDQQRVLVCEFTPTGTVIRANARFQAFLGLDRNPVGADHDRLMDHATGLIGQSARLRHRIVADLQDDLATGGMPPTTYLNGRSVEWTYTRIDDLDGSLLSVVAVGHDVTQRVLGLHAQRMNEERFRAIISNISETVVVLAADGTVLETNASRRNALDHDASFWERIHLIEVLHPDDRSAASAALQALIGGGLHERRTMEARAVNAAGEYIWVEMSGINLLDEPSIEAVLITVRNVDERRSAQAELEQAQASQRQLVDDRQRFLGAVSHELRNLVHGTLGLTEALDLIVADRQSRELTSALVSHAGTLRRVVDDLLDYSMIADGRVHVERTSVDLASLLGDLGEVNRPNARPGVGMYVLPIDPTLRIVQADQHRLRQALQNLISNAIHHTEAGAITLAVGSGGRNDMVRIEVRDTGSGIDPAEKDRLFLPYVRGPRERSTGTGLGLTISKLAVELMDGAIGVLPRDDGSTFWIELPRGNETVDGDNDEDIDLGDYEPLDVLVIDDDPVNLLVATMQLDDAVRRVRTVSTVAEALHLVHSNHFDVVLCDLHLGDETGFDFLRSSAGLTDHPMYVVIMTGDTDPSVAAELLAAGAQDFLHKPANRRDMERTLRRAHSWRKTLEEDGASASDAV